MNQINKQTVRWEAGEVAVGAEEETRPVASLRPGVGLIKLGASAVPVLATLSSQSALAGQMHFQRLRGALSQISNSASEAARHASHAVEVTTGYTISAWNSTEQHVNATAWTAFYCDAFFGSSPAANALTFSVICLQNSAPFYAPYFWNPSSFGVCTVADFGHGPP